MKIDRTPLVLGPMLTVGGFWLLIKGALALSAICFTIALAGFIAAIFLQDEKPKEGVGQ